jgi:hypothetical protein
MLVELQRAMGPIGVGMVRPSPVSAAWLVLVRSGIAVLVAYLTYLAVAMAAFPAQ